MNEKVYQQLNELCAVLHDRYCINWGGCAFVAYCVARNLEKLSISYKVVLDGRLSAKELFCRRLSCAHVFIVAEDKYLVNDDYSYIHINNIPSYRIIELTSKELLKYYREANTWNKEYNKVLNSIVSRKINKFFKIIL